MGSTRQQTIDHEPAAQTMRTPTSGSGQITSRRCIVSMPTMAGMNAQAASVQLVIRDDLTVDRARDLIWLYIAPEINGLLVERNWTIDNRDAGWSIPSTTPSSPIHLRDPGLPYPVAPRNKVWGSRTCVRQRSA